MRKPIIAGNWKMNTDPESAFELMDTMLEDLDAITDVDIVICPPYISLETFADMFDGTSLFLGAQNMFWAEKGAYTGEISPLMLKGMCDYVILGHSERRKYFHETDEDVQRKVQAALAHDINPIICVGEDLEQNEAEETLDVVSGQVSEALRGVDGEQVLKCVVAYEPIWAIGTGKPATGEGANGVIGFIRKTIASLYSEEIAQQVRIQYGGSVNSKNIAEFVPQPEIDGALVGGASLDPNEFIRICAVTNDVKGKAAAAK
jgi:triosephosphate isomerase